MRNRNQFKTPRYCRLINKHYCITEVEAVLICVTSNLNECNKSILCKSYKAGVFRSSYPAKMLGRDSLSLCEQQENLNREY